MELQAHHYRLLQHIHDVHGVFGWEEYDDTLSQLEDHELVIGRWMGSLDYPARPVWQVSDKGRQLLKIKDQA